MGTRGEECGMSAWSQVSLVRHCSCVGGAGPDTVDSSLAKSRNSPFKALQHRTETAQKKSLRCGESGWRPRTSRSRLQPRVSRSWAVAPSGMGILAHRNGGECSSYRVSFMGRWAARQNLDAVSPRPCETNECRHPIGKAVSIKDIQRYPRRDDQDCEIRRE